MVSRRDLSLEHKMLNFVRRAAPPSGLWLLAVSGGVDSMALAELLYRWRRLLRIQLVVGHVHHGVAQNSLFRARAQAAVRAWCRRRRVKFITNRPPPESFHLQSEDELRRFRWRALRRWQRELGAEVIAAAHHRDDLLETRVLRLLRGTGLQGMQAMQAYDAQARVLRPLLSVTHAELEDFAAGQALEWVEDPSNECTEDALRNWVRHEWLPELELRQQGATNALARSLEILTAPSVEPLDALVGLRREALCQAPQAQREATVAAYLRTLVPKGYGRTHIQEILKRVNTKRREFDFEILGLRFHVTPDLVWASRV